MSGRVIGIDPGLAGGVAVLDVETGSVMSTQIMPITGSKRREVDAPALAATLRSESDVRLVVVERVGAMPRQGLSSTF